MAKLKRWVVYLIISIILAISLAGLGVGLYYIFKPEPKPNPGDTPYVLTPEQEKFVEAVNGNPKNFSSNYFSSVVYADGSLVDIMQIEYVVGNIAVIKDGTGVPRFFTFNEAKENSTIATAAGLATEPNTKMVFTPVDVKTDYKYIANNDKNEYYITPSHAIVYDNANNYSVISLKTGDVILDVSDCFANSSTDGFVYKASRVLQMQNNYMVVEEQSAKPVDSAGSAEIVFAKTVKVINLSDVNALKSWVYEVKTDDQGNNIEIASNSNAEMYVTSKVENGYMVVVTTKFTHVYAPNPLEGELVETISPIANTFTLATDSSEQFDDQFVTFNGNKYSYIEYSDVVYLPNNTFLVEKISLPAAFDGTSQAFGEHTLFGDNFAKYSYSVYNLTSGSYVQTKLDTSAKLTVKTSNIDGYIFLTEERFLSSSIRAAYYDYNFNPIIDYDYGYNGEVVYYNANKGVFVTNSNNSSNLIDIKGSNKVSFVGYKLYSKTSANNFIILKGNDDYILYNVESEQYYYYNFMIATQITDGKIVGYIAGDCFYLVDLKNSTIDEIPYVDTLSVNSLMASLGYYVENKAGKYLLTTTNGAVSGLEIDRPNYTTNSRIINGKVYTMFAANGTQKLIISDYISNFGTYSAEEIEQNFVIDQKHFDSSEDVSLTAVLDPLGPPVIDNIDGGSNSSYVADNSNNESAELTYSGSFEVFRNVKGLDERRRSESAIVVNRDKSVPSYEFNIQYTDELPTEDRSDTNFGIGWKYYKTFSAAKAALPLKEGAVLYSKSSNAISNLPFEYKFVESGNRNNGRYEYGGFVGAWEYYCPYGKIYILALKDSSASSFPYKHFIILDLDKSVYVEGNMSFYTKRYRYDSNQFNYTVDGNYQTQMASNGTGALVSADYSTNAYARYVGGLINKDNDGAQYVVPVKGLVTNENNKRFFDSSKTSFEDSSDRYYDIYTAREAFSSTLGKDINIKLYTACTSMWAGQTSINYISGNYADSGSTRLERFFVNEELAFVAENSEYENTVGNSSLIKNHLWTNSSGTILSDNYNPNTKESMIWLAPDNSMRDFTFRYYSIEGSITLRAETDTKDGFFIWGHPEVKDHAHSVEEWRNGQNVDVYPKADWWDGDGKPRNVNHIKLLTFSVQITLKQENTYNYYHLYEAVEYPEKETSNIEKDTHETLFVYRDGFNRISYGFVSQKKYASEGEVIGSKRTNLKKFVDSYTAGYNLDGYGKNNSSSSSTDYKIFNVVDGLYARDWLNNEIPQLNDLMGLSNNSNIMHPVQETIKANFVFNYVDPGYTDDICFAADRDTSGENKESTGWSFDGFKNGNITSLPHYWWKATEKTSDAEKSLKDYQETYHWIKSIQHENIKYRESIITPTIGGGNKIEAPKGYSIVGWYLEKYRTFKNHENDEDGSKGQNAEGKLFSGGEKIIFHDFSSHPDYTQTDSNGAVTDRTINFYAVYTRNTYNLQITAGDSGLSAPKLYIYNGTKFEEKNLTDMLASDVLYHGKQITIPTLYIRDESNDTYKLVTLDMLNGNTPTAGTSQHGENINASTGGETNRTFYFTYDNFTMADKENPTEWSWTNRDTIKVTASSFDSPKYGFTYAQNANNHVYTSEDRSGQINNALQGLPTVTFEQGETTLEFKDISTRWEGVSGGSAEAAFVGGNTYTIKYSNFMPGYKLSFTFTYITEGDEEKSEEYEIQRSGKGVSIKIDREDATNGILAAGKQVIVNLDIDRDVLTLTFMANHGYFSVENNAGKFNGQITINDVQLDTQAYSISAAIREEDENGNPLYGEEFTNVNINSNSSISEWVNGRKGVVDGVGSTQVLGLGSTLMVDISSGLSKLIHELNYYALNQYISGLQIEFNGVTYSSVGTSGSLKDLAESVALLNGAKRFVFEDGITDQNNSGIVVGKSYLDAFINMLYGITNTSDDYENFKTQTYYGVNTLTLKNGDNTITVYIIMVNNADYGIKTALLFDIYENFVYDANKDNTIGLKISYVKYKNPVTINFNNNGSADSVNSDDVTLTWGEESAYESGDNPLDNEGIKPLYANPNKGEQNNTTLNDIAPSNWLRFNLNAKNGYYFKKVTITHGDDKYTVTFNGYTIDSGRMVISPIYTLSNTVGKNIVSNMPKIYIAVNNGDINMGTNDTLLTFTIANITRAVTIDVEYGAYSLVNVAAAGGINSIGYNVNGNDIYIYETDAGKKISSIIVNGITLVASNPENKNVWAVAYNATGTAGVYDQLEQGNFTSSSIFFMITDYAVNTSYNGADKPSGNYIELTSELTDAASYELAKNETDDSKGTLSFNTATFENVDFNTKRTQKYVTKTVNGLAASYIVEPKAITTYITSNIAFGNDNIYEEVLEGKKDDVLTAEDGSEKDITYPEGAKFISENEFYDFGQIANSTPEENFGQIVSTGTTIGYVNQNYGEHKNGNYYHYADDYKVFGNTLIIIANTAYGYTFEGFTLNIRVDGVAGTITKTSGTNDVLQFDINGSTFTFGNYTITNIDDNKTRLDITITNIDIELFEIRLNYKAKKFEVEYDTSADFGTSYVQNSVNADPSVKTNTPNATRPFVYNLRSAVDEGSMVLDTAGNTHNYLVYSRIGYNLIGWSYNAASKNESGETIKNGTVYKLATDSKISTGDNEWYNHLGEGKGEYNIFANGGKVTMYAVWSAREYNINLVYNDSTNGKGSTASTKYNVKWRFDNALTVQDVRENQVQIDSTAAGLYYNKLSRVYRLGYAFNGWYFGAGFEDDTLMYNAATSYGENASLENANLNFDLFTAIYGKDSWGEGETKENEFNDDVGGDGTRVVGENTINLYAKWTANTYSLVFDLNDTISSDISDGNTFTNITYNANNKLLNASVGAGSSEAGLGFTKNGNQNVGKVTIVFDTDFGGAISAYAYRNGYKFAGWFATRNGNDTGLVENLTLNRELLLYLLNKDNQNTDQFELAELKNKFNQTFRGNVLETLKDEQALVTIEENSSSQKVSLEGNLILLHARWEALSYYINVDLNNWNNPDFAWEDADYYIAGQKQNTSTNAVSRDVLTLEVLFDKKFDSDSTKLYFGGKEVKDDLEYYVRGKKYIATGSAYDKYIAIITSYGYNLGANDGYNLGANDNMFTLKGNGGGASDGGLLVKDTTIFNNEYYVNSFYYIDNIDPTNQTDIVWTNTPELDALDLSGHNVGDRHLESISNADESNAIWGTRTFTLFALWTLKEDMVNNVGYTVDPENVGNTEGSITLGTTNTQLTSTTDEEKYINYNYNTGEQSIFVNSVAAINIEKDDTTNITSSSLTYYNNPDILFVTPSGQYASELVLTFTDSINQVMGQLKLVFEWDKYAKHLVFKEAYTKIFTYDDKVASQTDWVKISDLSLTENEGLYTLSFGKLNYMFEGLVVETTNYKVTENSYNTITASKNVNKDYTAEVEEGYGNLDVCFIVLRLSSIKGNVYISATNKAQTYDVNYYRYIRPIDTMQTHIDQDEGSDNYGREVWDDKFLNGWNQYEVYKTLTYRYGEYVSTSYNYVAGFGFENWYHYQGHLISEEFDDYANPYNPSSNPDEQTVKVFTAKNVNDGDLEIALESAENQAYKHLADFIGTWAVSATYDWKTMEDGTYAYVNQENASDFIPGKAVYAADNSVSYTMFTDESGNNLSTLYLHTYNYNDSYKDYAYARSPITSNASLVGVYNPTSINQVHYYVWANNKYVDRDISSSEYILGKKYVAEVTGLSEQYRYIEYWQLGTNSEYYRVGFSGIENSSATSALAFMLQFVNNENYPDYKLVNGKLTIDYSTISNLVANVGVTVNGKTFKAGRVSDDPLTLATALLKELIKNGDYNLKGPKVEDYLNDYEVVKYFNLGDAIVNIGIDNTLDDLYTVVVNGSDSTDEAKANAIVDKLSIENLNMLLDSIATDYFGFVLKNPTSTIGSWPSNTYFAGWYMVGADLLTELTSGDLKQGYALTYNSDTWVGNSPSCLVVKENKSSDGVITYTLSVNGNSYEVTRFKTVDPQGYADMQSRVDRDVYVFGAYNAQRFTMDVDGSDNSDIQMGSAASDIDGNNYQYSYSDVRYVILNKAQFDDFNSQFALNNNKPTSLATALGYTNGELNNIVVYANAQNNYNYFMFGEGKEIVTGSFADAVARAKNTDIYGEEGGYIFAFVYQIKEVMFDKTTDIYGNVTITRNIIFDNYIINVADQYYHNGSATIIG